MTTLDCVCVLVWENDGGCNCGFPDDVCGPKIGDLE